MPLIGSLGTKAVMAEYAGFRRLRFSFFLDEPAWSLAGVWVYVPGGAQSFASLALLQEAMLELGACSSVG